MSGPMSDLLHGSVGNTCFSDASSTGYQNSRSVLGSDLYLNKCNSNFQMHLDFPTQSPHLWSPFDQQRDTTPHQPDSYPHNLTGLAYMQSQALLCQASAQELIASQNSAYMRLYKDNIKLMGHIESLEKAYKIIASAQGASSLVAEEVIKDTTPENPEDYPKIIYWHK
ncbi:hypothetical protein V8E53_004973, partial [Lactarius tabidus]